MLPENYQIIVYPPDPQPRRRPQGPHGQALHPSHRLRGLRVRGRQGRRDSGGEVTAVQDAGGGPEPLRTHLHALRSGQVQSLCVFQWPRSQRFVRWGYRNNVATYIDL